MHKVILAGLIAIWATTATAHSPLQATTPAHHAIIAETPTEITFDFNGEMRLTRVTATHEDQGTIDLDLSGYDGFISAYSIPLEPMGSGIYTIEWRGLAEDGHATNGTFSFMVE